MVPENGFRLEYNTMMPGMVSMVNDTKTIFIMLVNYKRKVNDIVVHGI